MNLRRRIVSRSRPPAPLAVTPPLSASELAFEARAKRHRRARQAKRAVWGVAVLLATPFALFWSRVVGDNRAQLKTVLPVTPALSPNDRLLVVSPHPDDETLGAAGTIAQARRLGVPVRVVFATCGDASGATIVYERTRRLSSFSFRDLAPMRRREALGALKKLGVSSREAVFLGFPDNGLGAMWNAPDSTVRASTTQTSRVPYEFALAPGAPYRGNELLRQLAAQMRAFRPTLVLSAHQTDTHADHAATGNFSRAAIELLRRSPRSPSWTRRVRWRGFLVHHGIWPVPNGLDASQPLRPPAALSNVGLAWTETPLSRKTRARKLAALESYGSQLASTPLYLRSFVRANELFATPDVGQNALSQRDVTANSPTRAAWPASDVRSLAVVRWDNGALGVRVRLMSAPSSRVRLHIPLHAIEEGRAPKLKVGALDIAWRDKAWKAVFTAPDGAATLLPVRVGSDSLGCEVPPRATERLIARAKPATLWTQAQTRWNNTELDSTPAAMLRLTPSQTATRRP